MPRRGVPTEFPEGGWGWVVCLASSWTNGVVFGIINSFGVLYVKLLELDGATAFNTSWIGAVTAGLMFSMTTFASIITDKLGCRRTAVIGGALAFIGIFTSSFVKRLEYMYITYGVIMGLGFAIAYQPSLYILGLYFQKRLGVANGLVTFGSAVFTVVLPIVMREILDQYGLVPCFWFQSSIVFVMLAGSFTFRPVPETVVVVDIQEKSAEAREDGSMEGKACCGRKRKRSNPCSNIIDLSIWNERNYRIWVIAVPLGLFGYFVPFFHLVKHVNDTMPTARAELLIMCLGATSGIGRLVSGFLSDRPWMNPIYIQQVAFCVIGVSTTLMPVINNFVVLCVVILIMGFFDGAFVSMMGPIAFNLVGPQRASQAIGCILGLMSVPMMVGPPIAGILYDTLGNYEIAFILSGIPPIFTACVLCLIRADPQKDTVDDRDKESKGSANDTGFPLLNQLETSPSMADKESDAMLYKGGMNGEVGKDELARSNVEENADIVVSNGDDSRQPNDEIITTTL